MLKDPYLRLLMNTVGIQRLSPGLEETLESIWTIPPDVTADQLKDYVDLINAAEFNPPTFENGEAAEKQLRRKTNRTRAYVSSDEDDENEELFPAGGPTARRAIDGEQRPKKSGRRRRRRSQSPDEAELDERARKRKEKERERRSKVKSEMYVYDSDLDSEADREFFAREEELRQKNQAVAEAAGQTIPGILPANKKNGKKRKKTIMDDDSEDAMDISQRSRSKTASSGAGTDEEEASSDGSDSDTRETLLESSSRRVGGQSKRRRVSDEELSDAGPPENEELPIWTASREPTGDDKPDEDGDVGMKAAAEDDDDDDEPIPSARPRARVKGGFIIDSSDEDE
jgi:replication fork protection complex subunit Tof1/Swi1